MLCSDINTQTHFHRCYVQTPTHRHTFKLNCMFGSTVAGAKIDLTWKIGFELLILELIFILKFIIVQVTFT